MAAAMVDTRYGHLYTCEKDTWCMCGLVAREGTTLIPALEVYHNKVNSIDKLDKVISSSNTGDQKIIVDSFSFKKSAIITALETAANLSNIGMILSC